MSYRHCQLSSYRLADPAARGRAGAASAAPRTSGSVDQWWEVLPRVSRDQTQDASNARSQRCQRPTTNDPPPPQGQRATGVWRVSCFCLCAKHPWFPTGVLHLHCPAQQPRNQPTPPDVMHPSIAHCTPRTSVSTPLHLPLSTRLDEISLAPAGHIGVGFGPFGAPGSPRGPLQRPTRGGCPQ